MGRFQVVSDLLEVGRGRAGVLEDRVHDLLADHGRREALEEIAVRIGGDLGVDIDDAEGALVQGRLHPGPVLVVVLVLRGRASGVPRKQMTNLPLTSSPA